MKIVRKQGSSKVVFELTDSELRRAYEEYEHICDAEDVKSIIKEKTEDASDRCNDVPVEWLEKHVDNIAYLKRKYSNNYGSDWITATQDAIVDYIKDYYEAD